MSTVAVIGAGSWGTSASWLLGGKGHDVRLWSREAEIADGVNAEHKNPLYLPDVVLNPSVFASPDMEEALRGAEAVVMVTPSVGVRETAESMKPHVFTITTRDFSGSVSVSPSRWRCPSITSVSTRFFGHPSETMPTVGSNGGEEFFMKGIGPSRASPTGPGVYRERDRSVHSRNGPDGRS